MTAIPCWHFHCQQCHSQLSHNQLLICQQNAQRPTGPPWCLQAQHQDPHSAQAVNGAVIMLKRGVHMQSPASGASRQLHTNLPGARPTYEGHESRQGAWCDLCRSDWMCWLRRVGLGMCTAAYQAARRASGCRCRWRWTGPRARRAGRPHPGRATGAPQPPSACPPGSPLQGSAAPPTVKLTPSPSLSDSVQRSCPTGFRVHNSNDSPTSSGAWSQRPNDLQQPGFRCKATSQEQRV